MEDNNVGREDKLIKDEFDTETAAELGADDMDTTRVIWQKQKSDNKKYSAWIQALPELIKALLIISWVCAALAAFVSVYFSVLGIITAYAANRAVPGVGRAPMITNIVLSAINILLSIAFLATVKNIFAIF